jgi:hypothetical protein
MGGTIYALGSGMPFKSQAQRRKFAKLMVEGKISPETFEEWNRETGSAKLPEHVRRKPAGKTARKKSAAKKTKVAKKTKAAKKTTRPKKARSRK